MNIGLHIDIFRPLPQVFTFVSRPENDFYWQYGTLAADQISIGEMSVGTLFRSVGHFMGRRFESVYEVTEYMPNQVYGFRSQSGPIGSYTVYTFEIIKGVTRMAASIQASLCEPFKTKPLMAEKAVKKEYKENLALLKEILESSRTGNPAGSPL